MNLIQSALNIYLYKKEPVSLIHFITLRCNARCRHCFIDFNNKELSGHELSLAEIDQLTRKLGSQLYNINLTGGEPFLRHDLFDIVSLYARNTSIKVINITTNGMYPEAVRSLIVKFKKLGLDKKLMFSISIDNFEALHDDNRNVKGLFQNALKTYALIDSYKDSQISATIAITITSYNYANVSDLYQHLKNQGIRSFFPILMREEGIAQNIAKKKEIVDAYVRLTTLIKNNQAKERASGMKRDLVSSYLKARNLLLNNILAKTYSNNKFISPCPAGSLFGIIYANGDIFPCEILGDHNLGNIKDHDWDLIKLLKTPKAKQCRDHIKRTRCHCTFECAWSVNIISNIKFLPQILFYMWQEQQ